ncbi:MAG: hypothetical protein JHC26_00430 [Thermofilum sp.]|jgi:hypothetical protein|uniref:hypothetical protein n=1 Tax=Thermofilum sp. TaxID=1961369 RepID=UPI00258EA1A4|nr:hypothetical protein [Thermofilum sp.]MCI4407531.1 hypothetical protein [Thermofilum sp.]
MSNINVEKIENVKIKNLTPHELVILDENNNVIARIPPSGVVARVQSREELIGYINGIPIFKTVYGNIENLPDPEPGVVYAVSIVVLTALKEKGIKRTDVISPNTNPSRFGAVRDAQGRIIGVKSFIVL